MNQQKTQEDEPILQLRARVFRTRYMCDKCQGRIVKSKNGDLICPLCDFGVVIQ